MKIRIVALTALAFAAAIGAGSASAATVVGATTVRITNSIPTWLQIAEVRALDFDDVNVALAGTAFAPDKYSTFVGPPGGYLPGADDGPENAIDDVIPFAQGYAGPGFPGTAGIYHSGTEDNTISYLQITFAAPVTLKSLEIYGRTDNNVGSRDFYKVEIRNADGELLFSDFTNANNEDHVGSFNFDEPIAVPEPATWALMIGGFGMAGAMIRRRRAITTA